MAEADDAADLILRMVRGVLDTPGVVRVMTVSEGGGTTFRVSVSGREIAQIIGKQGRTERALRTILAAISMRDRQRYTLDIMQDVNYPDSGEGEGVLE